MGLGRLSTGAALLAAVGVHFPLIMNEAADAEAQNGDECGQGHYSGENISSGQPAGDIADQPGSQARYGDCLVELLLFLVLQNICGSVFFQESRRPLNHRVIPEYEPEQTGCQRNRKNPVQPCEPG
ncbi:hypothetical protein D3C73_1352060 [compost metagenome]